MGAKWDELSANKASIVERYLGGESMGSLARAFNCNGGYIWKFLNEMGVPLRQIKKVEPNYDAILQLHSQGLSAYAINKQLGLTKNTAERALQKAGVNISAMQKRHPGGPLLKHYNDIVARYQAGEGCDVIASDYNTTRASVMRLLRREGIVMRDVRDYAYLVNEAFFDVIDAQEKAYILGFMMADGCNMPQVPCFSIGITDKDILEDMKRAIGFEGPLARFEPRGKGRLVQWRMLVGSRRMSDALVRLGCVRGKTYVATFPAKELVPSHLQRHLIRGWMDGDGSIYYSVRKEKKCWAMRIVGTEAACRGISECVNKHLGFAGSVSFAHKGEKHTTWGFTISSRPTSALF